MRLARDIIVERAIARSSFDPWCPLFIICISRFRAIHPSTGREKKEFLIELELFSAYVLQDYFHDRDPRMTRRWIVNFFFFISLVDSFVDSKINLYRFAVKFERSSKKKKSFRCLVELWFCRLFGTFIVLGYAQLDHRHHAIVILRLFFFFFGHLCLFDVRVSSNHVAFDSWN